MKTAEKISDCTMRAAEGDVGEVVVEEPQRQQQPDAEQRQADVA